MALGRAEIGIPPRKVAARPIEFPYHQRVTRAKGFEGRLQARMASNRPEARS